MRDRGAGEDRASGVAGEGRRLPERGAQATLLDYPRAIDALTIRREQIEATIGELRRPRHGPRLRCLRGIDTLTAVGLCARSATSLGSSGPRS